MTTRDYKTEDFDLVDLYITFNYSEAQFIKDMLDANDIANFLRSMESTPFPMTVGEFGETRIVVEDDKLDPAIALIRQAIADDAITSEGRFTFEDE